MRLKRPVLSSAPIRQVARQGQSGTAAVYKIRGHARSGVVCDAVCRGLMAAGYNTAMHCEDQYSQPTAKVAAFYGFVGNLPRIIREYPKAVFVDLGYWGRRGEGRFTGYNKIAVNDRHPTAYFRTERPDFSRVRKQGVSIEPYRKGGDKIIVAGMSAKAAMTCGFKPGEWERRTVETLQKHTDRPIVFRPKPTCKFSRMIPGTEWQDPTIPLEVGLKDAFALVTRHSNAAVEALLHGVPVFVEDGVALGMGQSDLSLIECPYYPDDRNEWAADIAWTHWTLDELSTAEPWDHLKSRGVL